MNPTTGLLAKIGVRRSDSFSLDIDLAIEPGTTAALLGPNGSGKSTTVDSLAGILPLDSGRIELGGRVLDDPAEDIYVLAEDRHVGVVFQRYLLFDHLSVVDNVAFGPTARGVSRHRAHDVAVRWMDLLDLGPLAAKKPAELSGGQSQRVALARALATDPALLLLDEPLAALDIGTRTHLRRALTRHLAEYQGPRLLITHDPADAFLLADKIHILEEGRVTQAGTAEDIRRRPATAYAAALAGLNLLSGTNVAGTLSLDHHAHELTTSDIRTTGPVLITINPNAIALHQEQPHGSPRNTWRSSIATLESLGDITRVTLDGPLPVSVDITPAAADSMGLRVGAPIWASVKATEIHLNPA